MNESGKLGMFFIGGAPKSGTTALYYYLRQHPGIYLPKKKELHYFSRPDIGRRIAGKGDKGVVAEIPETFDAYMDYYKDAPEGASRIDISPSYLFYSNSASRIVERFPESKIVFLLRNPADKAFSQYMHLRSVCRESLEFGAALQAEIERDQLGFSDIWLYKKSGYYADALETFINVFGRHRVNIFTYNEFVSDPARVVMAICAFFAARDDFEFKVPGEVNRSGLPKSKLVAKMLLRPNAATGFLRRVVPANLGREIRGRLRNWNSGDKAHFDPEIRASLLANFSADIYRVEQIMGRETGWLTK